jgi:hypothetical protein
MPESGWRRLHDKRRPQRIVKITMSPAAWSLTPATWPCASRPPGPGLPPWPGRSRGCGPCYQPRGWPGHLTVLTAPATAAHTTRPRTALDPQALSASVSRPASATSTSRRPRERARGRSPSWAGGCADRGGAALERHRGCLLFGCCLDTLSPFEAGLPAVTPGLASTARCHRRGRALSQREERGKWAPGRAWFRFGCHSRAPGLVAEGEDGCDADDRDQEATRV